VSGVETWLLALLSGSVGGILVAVLQSRITTRRERRQALRFARTDLEHSRALLAEWITLRLERPAFDESGPIVQQLRSTRALAAHLAVLPPEIVATLLHLDNVLEELPENSRITTARIRQLKLNSSVDGQLEVRRLKDERAERVTTFIAQLDLILDRIRTELRLPRLLRPVRRDGLRLRLEAGDS
jgi:hypothetical protein